VDCVYYLVDPTTRAIRWVGCTKNPQTRLNEHRAAATGGHGCNEELLAWVYSTLPSGPTFMVKCWLQDKATAIRVETLLTEALRAKGELLLNKFNGNTPTESRTLSAETRARLSAANAGQTRSEETCRNISKALAEFYSDPANCDALSKRIKEQFANGRKPTIHGNKYTLSQRLARSAAWTPEMRAAQAQAQHEIQQRKRKEG
jgi:hypothetical protein